MLESTNDVFFKIMTEKLGSVAYTEDAALHPGAGYEPLPESASEEERDFSTELLLINTKDSILEELDDDSADYTRQELEARMIGMRIRELTDPEKGCLVWDKEEGAYRRAEYRGYRHFAAKRLRLGGKLCGDAGTYGNPCLCRIEDRIFYHH